MKYLIVGLGNIGPEYADTRHNIGFMVADALAKRHGVSFASSRFGVMAELKHRARTLCVLKPDTYMNLSGKAVMHHLNALKLTPERLLVITDDIALPFGKMRLRGKGSHGGHNGLRNIQELLGTDVYARLRMGVGSSFTQGRQVDYVLGPFAPEEQKEMPTWLDKAADAVEAFTFEGIERTMNVFNT